MPKVVITGASSGIGLELARIFAKKGYELVLVARNEARLRELAGELAPVRVDVIALDLTRDDAPEQLFKATGPVDVMINNAGFGVYGKFVENSWSEERQLIDLNVTALVALTKLYLPPMVAAGKGRVMNVASTAAFQPGPLMACYYASKAFVLSFSEAIANEVKGTGVTVTALCPGATSTEFASRAGLQQSRLFRSQKAMSASKVAEIGYRGLMRGKPVVITGLRNRILAQSVRFTPRALVVRIARLLQEKVH